MTERPVFCNKLDQASSMMRTERSERPSVRAWRHAFSFETRLISRTGLQYIDLRDIREELTERQQQADPGPACDHERVLAPVSPGANLHD